MDCFPARTEEVRSTPRVNAYPKPGRMVSVVLQRVLMAQCQRWQKVWWQNVFDGKMSWYHNVGDSKGSFFLKWHNVVMAECCSGKMLCWQNVAVALCCDGNMSCWHYIVMAICCDGNILRWQYVVMAYVAGI